MKQIEVTSQDAKQRLDKYLKRIFPEMGTSFLYKMLRKKNITLNGKKATGSEQIQSGDLIQCFFSDETFDKFAGIVSSTESGNEKQTTDSGKVLGAVPVNSEYKKAYDTLKGISVIYEDEHILLLDKPAGILSQKANPQDMSLNEWMIGYLLNSNAVTADSLKRFKPSVCNRLDRNTSGLVICGKTLHGSREMSRMLKDRSLQKYYRTYVHGRLQGEKVLEGYHQKNEKNNQAKILFSKPSQNIEQYDPIITAYRSIESKSDYSYLEIELITGKTHQIRAHLSAYGYPIVGDTKYGTYKVETRKANVEMKSKKAAYSKTGIDKNFPKHQLLHAYRIMFPTLDGELAHLSNKEFVCEEPVVFKNFRDEYFK